MATPLQNANAMAVMLIILGIAVKLALSVAATYRSRFWWAPGTVATACGALALGHGDRATTVGQAGIMLGLVAVLLARGARAGAPVR